jgi:hypothetical protein
MPACMIHVEDDKLRESLYELRQMNEVFDGFLIALEAARGHNEVSRSASTCIMQAGMLTVLAPGIASQGDVGVAGPLSQPQEQSRSHQTPRSSGVIRTDSRGACHPSPHRPLGDVDVSSRRHCRPHLLALRPRLPLPPVVRHCQRWLHAKNARAESALQEQRGRSEERFVEVEGSRPMLPH